MLVKYYQRLQYEPGEGKLDDPNGLGLWLNAYRTRNPCLVRALIVAYFCGETIPDCFKVVGTEYKNEIDILLDWFVDSIRQIPLNDLVSSLRTAHYALIECVDNIPQLSTLVGSTLTLVDTLAMSDSPLTYVRIGYHLYGTDLSRNETAKRKYGENAAKFAAILGLVRLGHDIIDPTTPNRIAVELTCIGNAVARAKGDRLEIVARLLMRVALFRDFICSDCARNENIFWTTISQLSPVTRLRRTSAFSAMLTLFRNYGGTLADDSRAEELLCRMRR